ncbi:MAG: DUF1080 domain-containing protein [Planctomycetaceae bacterium]|nr:DUF1080 domain-containing protein [Planctomycetaceae bacterium]
MIRSFTTLSLCLCWLGISLAEEKPQLPAADEHGWRKLFDGKTLTNWQSTNFGGEGVVSVVDGALVMRQGEPLTGVTWKGAELPKVNYEIELETKRIEGNDFFCALTCPIKDSACSLVLGGWGGTVVGISSINGFDASENETTDYLSVENDKWYKVKLKVTDTHIQAWLDGEQIANVDYTDKEISVRIEVEVSRPLGLSTFQTVGAVRNFRMRELKEDK